eukprot:2078467-Pyramimonas_sp.AAC.2
MSLSLIIPPSSYKTRGRREHEWHPTDCTTRSSVSSRRSLSLCATQRSTASLRRDSPSCLQRAHRALVQKLVELGANNINIPDSVGHTPLHWASTAGCAKIVRYIAAELHEDIHAQDDEGLTPLAHACIGCVSPHRACGGTDVGGEYVDVVQILVMLGADVLSQNEGKMTSIHFASISGSVEVVRTLVELGVDSLQVRDAGGQ